MKPVTLSSLMLATSLATQASADQWSLSDSPSVTDTFEYCALNALEQLEGYEVKQHPNTDTVYAVPAGSTDTWSNSYEVNPPDPADPDDTGSIVFYGSPDSEGWSVMEVDHTSSVVSSSGPANQGGDEIQEDIQRCMKLIV